MSQTQSLRRRRLPPAPLLLFRPVALLLPPLLALWGCGQGGKADQGSLQGVQRREPARVLVEPVVQREMVRRLETTTRVESLHQVELYPRTAGFVVEIVAEEGDRVEAGAVLARLDDREARIALSDAEVGLEEARADRPRLELAVREAESRMESALRAAEQARRDHERNMAIAKGGPDTPGLLSSKELEASRLALDQAVSEHQTAQLAWQRAKLEEQAGATAVSRAELALERARLDLSHRELTAPFAGVVAERRVEVGDMVSTGAAAFVLTDPDELQAVFYRPQRELPLFQGRRRRVPSNGSPAPPVSLDGAGAPASAGGDGAARPDGEKAGETLEILARADALPGLVFRGAIERVAPTIDAASGNFRVTARLESPPVAAGAPRLLPGMLVRLEIVTERHPDALVVPKRAIRREGDRTFVFVVEEGAARRVEVREAFADERDVEVEALGERALRAGEPVVVVGNRDLEDGAAVSVQRAGDASSGSGASPGPAGGGERGGGEAGVAGGTVEEGEGEPEAASGGAGAEPDREPAAAGEQDGGAAAEAPEPPDGGERSGDAAGSGRG